jgi:hypothetical protein
MSRWLVTSEYVFGGLEVLLVGVDSEGIGVQSPPRSCAVWA